MILRARQPLALTIFTNIYNRVCTFTDSIVNFYNRACTFTDGIVNFYNRARKLPDGIANFYNRTFSNISPIAVLCNGI
jgi:hypothetical protein